MFLLKKKKQAGKRHRNRKNLLLIWQLPLSKSVKPKTWRCQKCRKRNIDPLNEKWNTKLTMTSAMVRWKTTVKWTRTSWFCSKRSWYWSSHYPRIKSATNWVYWSSSNLDFCLNSYSDSLTKRFFLQIPNRGLSPQDRVPVRRSKIQPGSPAVHPTSLPFHLRHHADSTKNHELLQSVGPAAQFCHWTKRWRRRGK